MGSYQNEFFKDFIYLFLEKGEGREKERVGNIDVRENHRSVASHISPARDLAHNRSMCPDCKWNQRPFSLQDAIQSTEPHQSVLKLFC